MDETRQLNLEHRIYSGCQELWVRYGQQTLQVFAEALGTEGFALLLRRASIMASNLEMEEKGEEL